MNDLTLIAGTGLALPDAVQLNRHWIGGQWVASADTFERISPSHGVVVSRSALGGVAEAGAAIAAARAAFDGWSTQSGKARATVLLKVADLIEANVEAMARIETLETGKPIAQSRGEVSGAADLWRYAASLARTLHGDSHNTLGAKCWGWC
jgi:betaine-aldehyde dehydrogenase